MKHHANEHGLNPKQQEFADQWLVDRNSTQAAIRAGYSAHTANEQGCRLLANASVSAYLKAKSQTIADKLGITTEFVLRSMMDIGDLTKPHRKESNAAVSLKAYETLGKHLKLFEESDKKQQNVTINIVQF